MESELVIKPQEGPQTMFLGSTADIVFYGGGAGGGKTRGLLMDPLRATHLPGFTGVIFRRTYPDITAPGSLRDEAMSFYPDCGAEPKNNGLEWHWDSGAWLKFSHLQKPDDVLRWKGSQLGFVGFDEVTDFLRSQFFYIISRMRSTAGVNPWLRATCNPLPDSWVHDLIRWWLDDAGFPIKERAGVIRFMALNGNSVEWADTAEELLDRGLEPYSFTFIPALLADNPALLAKDPTYLKKLKGLPQFERETLLKGCWEVRRVAGMMFRSEWFEIIDEMEAPVFERVIRYWDRAATEPSTSTPDPDYTAGVKIGVTRNRKFVVLDVRRFRARPSEVRANIKNTAKQDGHDVEVFLEEDPGQAGKADIEALVQELAGFVVHAVRVTKAKALRANTASSQSENGNVSLVRGRWNKEFLSELDGFVDEKQVKAPAGYHDDQVDGFSGAMNALYTEKELGVREL